VRVSPLVALSVIAEVSFFATLPLKLPPSLSVTVADCSPAPDDDPLPQPASISIPKKRNHKALFRINPPGPHPNSQLAPSGAAQRTVHAEGRIGTQTPVYSSNSGCGMRYDSMGSA